MKLKERLLGMSFFISRHSSVIECVYRVYSLVKLLFCLKYMKTKH